MNRLVTWAGRIVATRTFKILFVVIIVGAILAAIFGDAEEPDRPPLGQGWTGTTIVIPTTARPPDTVRVIDTTTPTIVVSPTDTLLPPIDHDAFPRRTHRNLSGSRGGYCAHYAAWQSAEAEIAAIERRNPSDNANDWRAGDVGRWADAIDARAAAANRLWGAAPAGATWASVRSECG